MTATDDMAEIIALKPDCVSYCATAVRREEDAIADIAALLESGINVVTISTIPMVYRRLRRNTGVPRSIRLRRRAIRPFTLRVANPDS
ncbi:putative dihydrodipicolinate reductase [Mycobacterium intracellulare MIN_061107_1834]|nr:putative dihydrodipicolinate reductase [Mycobacterium intracellulare MIN_061107_1834]